MIRIATAYDDLLNLYGDYANVVALARYLRESGFLVETCGFSSGSYIDLLSVDMLYIGSGTERRLLAAMEDFKRFYQEIQSFVKKGGFILATGTAVALIGSSVVDFDGNIHEGPGLLDYDVTFVKKRSYREIIATSELIAQPVIGNVNSSMVITGRENPLFHVTDSSFGKRITHEGAHRNTVFATELSGPLLVRNPDFLHFFAEKVSDKKIQKNDSVWVGHAHEGYSRALAKMRNSIKGSIWQR